MLPRQGFAFTFRAAHRSMVSRTCTSAGSAARSGGSVRRPRERAELICTAVQRATHLQTPRVIGGFYRSLRYEHCDGHGTLTARPRLMTATSPMMTSSKADKIVEDLARAPWRTAPAGGMVARVQCGRATPNSYYLRSLVSRRCLERQLST
jgi:hypothetical protein